MRELKFRFYDTFNETMIYSDTFQKLSAFFRCYEETVSGKNNPSDLMQYTGLKDKNGKEIYGGNILAQMDNDIDHKGNWVVGYRDGTFMAECKKGIDDQWIPYWTETEIEIIGNIYENPELIN